ncbi:hypothetical protein L211DRAFT_854353 [Terfezia boudieri ATCC MYA-4762]|uniref:CCHC-type domain-containing protein n=1 Tax=Terfezia boudieri ATCC MYA-4762 TaxID=1051890 RepID=A0A3N4LC33_9PEZI|nr:hypothetical protein L211DRAFT_854353 [Terfezia boudieri ATCC MYA-4762]
MVETEEKLWKKISKVYVTIEVDQVDRKNVCSGCGKNGHTVDVCWKKEPTNTTSTTASNPTYPTERPPLCSICKRGRYEAKNCYSVVGRPGEEKPEANIQQATTVTTDASQACEKKDLGQATLTEFVFQQKSCYQCGKGSETFSSNSVRSCRGQEQENSYRRQEENEMCFYNIPTIGLHDCREQAVTPLKSTEGRRLFPEVDEKPVVLDRVKTPISLPLYQALSQTYMEREVFEVDKIPEDLVAEAEGFGL